jgi:hypothetical protein
MFRRRLPNRRASEILVFVHEGRRYRASVSRYPSGAIGEVFLDSAKFGSELALHASESAVLASLALQHGASSRELIETTAGPIATALRLADEDDSS